MIVGPEAAIQGFVAVGCVPMPANNVEEAIAVLTDIKKGIKDDSVAVVLVMEQFLQDMPVEDYDKLTRDPLPSIIPIPSAQGSTGFGNVKMSRIVEQAIGSDIFDN